MKTFLFAFIIFLLMTYIFIGCSTYLFNPLDWPAELQTIQPVISAASAFFLWLFLQRDERPIR